jgi:serine/threonine protein kinase
MELMCRKFVQVLTECHRRGVVHGDLKPDNIMTTEDKSSMVLLDFGTASVDTDVPFQQQGKLLLAVDYSL